MSQYIRQRNAYGCGPVVIFNSLRWAGFRISRRELPELYKETGCVFPEGTPELEVIRVLAERTGERMVIEPMPNPTLGNIEECVRNDGSVLLNFAWKNPLIDAGWHGHFTLIVGVSLSGRYFHVVNYLEKKNKALHTISRRMLRHDLRGRKRELWYSPTAWCLTIRTKPSSWWQKFWRPQEIEI